jgi:hypothetical protein
MKVRVGPYPDRLVCRIHTTYMQNKYGFKWPEQTRFENFLEKLEDFIQTLYTPINYFLDKRTQKVNVKIDRWDTWSMDHTLAHIVLPMLKQLKETKHGAPHVDWEDVPHDLRPTHSENSRYSTHGETDEFWFARWDYVLDEMIWAFEQKVKDDWTSEYYEYENIKPVEDSEDFSERIGLKLKWDDEDGRRKHQERMTNGFRLFGKYYENLWD